MGLFDRSAAQLDLMTEMFDRTKALKDTGAGIDVEFEMMSAVQTCLRCKSTDTCRTWMAAKSAKTVTAPGFCPNRHRIARMKRGL